VQISEKETRDVPARGKYFQTRARVEKPRLEERRAWSSSPKRKSFRRVLVLEES